MTPWLRRRLAGDAGIGVCSILLDWYTRLFHRLTISGKQHLQGLNGPLIVACNHSSPIDPLLIQAGFPKFIQWMMAIDQMPPDTQMIWRFTRIIPTDRRRPNARSAIQAIRSLRSDGSSAFSPKVESPYRQNTSCHSIRAWALASRTGAPVLLVHISGTSDSMSIAGALLRRSRTRIDYMGVMSWPDKCDPAKITEDLRTRLIEGSDWPATDETPPLPAETDPFLPS